MIVQKPSVVKDSIFLRGVEKKTLNKFKETSLSLGYNYNEFFEKMVDTYLKKASKNESISKKKSIKSSGRKPRPNKAPIN